MGRCGEPAALDATADREEEDAKLTAAGFQTEVPDPADPWNKYRSALGLERADFAPYATNDGAP